MDKVSTYQKFLDRYTGIGKAFRAYLLAKQQSANKDEFFQHALEVSKEQNLVGYYQHILDKQKKQVLSAHQEWYNQQKNQFTQEEDKINKDLNLYRSQNNQVSIRISLIELMTMYEKYGYYQKASETIDKINQYQQQQNQYLEIIDHISIIYLINEEYKKLEQKFHEFNGEISDQIDQRERMAVAYVCQLLRTLINGETNEFKKFVMKQQSNKHGLLSDDIPDSITQITLFEDLGNYTAVLGLYSNQKIVNPAEKREFSQLHNIYNNENIAPLILGSSYSYNIVENYVQLKYPECLREYRVLINELVRFDPILFDRSQFLHQVEQKLLIEYLKPFSKISFTQISKDFGYSEQQIRNNIIGNLRSQNDPNVGSQLAEDQKLNFVVDPIENCLIQKENWKTNKNKTYQQACHSIQRFLNTKQTQLLNYYIGKLEPDQTGELQQQMLDMASHYTNFQ